MKGLLMKYLTISTVAACILLGLAPVGFGQTIISGDGGAPLGFSRDLVGGLSVTSAVPGGCRTRVCTTNIVPEVHCTITNPTPVVVCRTNTYPRLECTTNFITEIHCRTNDLQVVVCETNRFPRLVCVTNGVITYVRCETNFIGDRVCVTNMVPRLVCTNFFTPSGAPQTPA